MKILQVLTTVFAFIILNQNIQAQPHLYELFKKETKYFPVDSFLKSNNSIITYKPDGKNSVQQFASGFYDLFPAKLNSKWGIINLSGTWVIQPKYDSIYNIAYAFKMETMEEYLKAGSGRSVEGYRYVISDIENYKYFWPVWVLETGKNYSCQFSFYNCRTQKLLGDKKITWLSREESYKDTINFLRVKDAAGNAGLLNGELETIIPLEYSSIDFIESKEIEQRSQYGDGIFYKVTNKGGYSGIYKIGKGEVIKTKYKNITYCGNNQNIFSEGYTFIQTNGKVGIVDSSGKEILPCEYSSIKFSLDSKIFTIRKDNKYGFYSITEKRIIIPVKYTLQSNSFPENTCQFKGNYCLITDSINRYAVIDNKGNLIHPFTAEYTFEIGKEGFLYKKRIDDENETYELYSLPNLNLVTKGVRYGYILPVFDTTAIVVQKANEMLLISMAGKTLYKFKSVACEGNFKVENANILKDKEILYAINGNKIEKIKTIDKGYVNFSFLPIFYNKKSAYISSDEEKLELHYLQNDLMWYKKQPDIINNGQWEEYAYVIKADKIGLYHSRSHKIAIEPKFLTVSEIWKYIQENESEVQAIK